MANTLNLFRNRASLLAKAFGVGFIDWLDLSVWNRHRLSIVCDENWQSSLRDLDVLRHRDVDMIYADPVAVAKANIVEAIVVTVRQSPVHIATAEIVKLEIDAPIVVAIVICRRTGIIPDECILCTAS